jgi:hypothetical protein
MIIVLIQANFHESFLGVTNYNVQVGLKYLMC